MTDAKIEAAGAGLNVVWILAGEQKFGDLGVAGVNPVLQTHAGGEKVLRLETQQCFDAVAGCQYLQPLGKRQPESALKQGYFHLCPLTFLCSQVPAL